MSSKTQAQASQSIVGAGLSKSATDILVKNLTTQTIAGGQGIDPANLDTDFVTLFLVILDETGSMAGDQMAVVMAFDEMIAALKDSKAADSILVSVWAFNSSRTRLIHSYLTLDLVNSLTDYSPIGGTNLYDATLDGVTSLLQYEEELKKAGTRNQTVVVCFTDGEDNASHGKAADVKAVVDSLMSKEKYVFSLVAFDRDNRGYATQTALDMGFANVLTAGATRSEIRKAMGTVSKSVIRASQTQIGKASQSGFFSN